jgi:hypothetical protein
MTACAPVLSTGCGSSELQSRARDKADIAALCCSCDCCRQPTDVEVFSFTAGAAGLATIGLSGASKMGSVVRCNLNVNLTLTGPTGTRITSQAGVGILPFSVSLPSGGTYTVSLTPVGVGDPKTDGYSAYGSRGQVGTVLMLCIYALTNCLCQARGACMRVSLS